MKGGMFTRSENRWGREQEYQALRRFIKLADSSEPGGFAGRVAAAVTEELTPRQRQMVTMYYMKQMTMRDIGETLGVSVSTVSRTVARGRARLRRALRYGSRALLDAMEE